jgi:hypothetical protein
MVRKTHDLAVKTGTYRDSQGQEKARYKTIGALMMGDKGPFVVIDRTFSPAGAADSIVEFSSPGTFTLRATVSDGRGGVTSVTFTWTIRRR